ncbi:16S rRNA (cytidine(1402)-2'-O)-methyltransferase [Fructobacillus evanidus]|uniref:Ribosomal RNA small subunit methyltransferase I n=1 Tax=Fructobacillus evanidus TaxID=3064281 RepID=A0ABM9MRP2_9LACO|nr:16S rRNA C1402 (ribose-2'-O) methylase RsmI (RsmI) [Fructobacillus sp. LMG 32999]CAK1235256.1 16S rRNA C1402 (ribose-2'-O) methylase RsmI (RsmI) [Fructobacillus sp. LMG 32999]CAK1235356.1 16S rRNA C1402 (ribose-2'-O) methylase RsmI (RsmI) [Fructobacillus sp. LMG 32999]CAK1235698.1 16S rRNA C1402 (ribose-2'-O) methylase RsmI (RsmI) [Fructobacillus sp. LMG 32999]CAK1238038.1 16S rRNA C1402 (ribose-2'-O) methylase RsmI (RsmI) [Fructobacillus sp. LMG 32999]
MQVQKSFAEQKTGTLYLVATPIGNLQDMSNRAIEVLSTVDVIAAEDTRHTQLLLNYFDIHTKKTALHEHNWQEKAPLIVQDLLAGQSVAQVSDAGLPSISDPGKELVAQAIAAGIPVVPVPGASAGITALIASGLVPQPFYFHGFLPRKKGEQQAALADLARRPETLIFYEAPHRLKATMENLLTVCGPNRRVVLARELTKRYEEFLRGTTKELADWLAENQARGEFVLMVAGASAEDLKEMAEPQQEDAQVLAETADLPVDQAVAELVTAGQKPNQAIKQVAKDRGLNRQEVYKIYHQIEEDHG